MYCGDRWSLYKVGKPLLGLGLLCLSMSLVSCGFLRHLAWWKNGSEKAGISRELPVETKEPGIEGSQNLSPKARKILREYVRKRGTEAKYLGTKGPFDRLEAVQGQETVIVGFQLGGTQLIFYQFPNKLEYAYGEKGEDGSIKWFSDADNDGVFKEETEVLFNSEAYGY